MKSSYKRFHKWDSLWALVIFGICISASKLLMDNKYHDQKNSIYIYLDHKSPSFFPIAGQARFMNGPNRPSLINHIVMSDSVRMILYIGQPWLSANKEEERQ